MQSTKYHRLRKDCLEAIGVNNLEKCFELLAESLDDHTSAYNTYLALRGRLSSELQMWTTGQVMPQEHKLTLDQIRAGLIHFVNDTLQPPDVSLLRRVHDRILILVAVNTSTDWEGLFPEAFFSHTCIIRYGEAVPEQFHSPDVIIFDDLDGPDHANYLEMKALSERMTEANLLYFGIKNPFNNVTIEEKAIYTRMTNANSKFTIHGRLKELLEFRGIYGSPASKNN